MGPDTSSMGSGNPVLDEIMQAHASLSPAAQKAVGMASAAAGGAPQPPAASPAPLPIAKPIGGAPLPNFAGVRQQVQPTIAPNSPLSLPSGPAPEMPAQGGLRVKAPLGTAQGDEEERARLLNSGSGISQIKNGGLRGLATAGNIIGGLVAPGLMERLPGTQEHHDLLVAQNARQLGTDIGNEGKQATTAETNSLPALHQAQAALGAAKLSEAQQHHQSQIEEQLHTHGYKTAEDGTIQPLAYEEMSPEQQGVHDLKASQQELADARAALVKAQKDNVPAAQHLAQQRIENAQRNAATAAGKLGLSRQEFQANYYGTDTAGNALPGAPATATGQPEGIRMASLTSPGPTARGKAAQGRAVVESAADLKDFIDKNKGAFGNIDQYWQQYMNGTPIADPTASKAMAKIASFAALQPALHGFRSHDAMREFAKMIGGIPKNPEALKAAIDGLVESAATPMIHAGTVRTVDQGNPEAAVIGLEAAITTR